MSLSNNGKTKVYIDALPIAQDKMSGIGHLTLEMIRALSTNKEFDYKYELILVLPLGKASKIVRHNLSGCKVATLPLPARALSLFLKLKLLPPVDLLIGRGVYVFPNYRNWPLLLSPSITYFHDVSFMLHPETVSPKNLKYLKHNARLWLKRTDLVATLSHSSKMEIIENLKIPEGKVKIIPCGVNGSIFYHRSYKEVLNIKHKYGLPEGNYIICVGNLEPRKNIDRLIAAYQKLPDKLRNDYALVLIGGGGWLNEKTMALINSARNNGLDIFHPKKYVEDEDLPALFSGAALAVHPAVYEGFGIPPIQAMSCRTLVAASAIDSIKEVVGEAALLFDPYSISDIMAKIETGLSDNDERVSLVKKGEKQSKKFTWEDSASILYKIIEELVDK